MDKRQKIMWRISKLQIERYFSLRREDRENCTPVYHEMPETKLVSAKMALEWAKLEMTP